ncbi:Ig-like domain-containing protein [Veronia nyctiphanis]|nr:Ig-like domain-containing protein [Veronia nyctiphanis]
MSKSNNSLITNKIVKSYFINENIFLPSNTLETFINDDQHPTQFKITSSAIDATIEELVSSSHDKEHTINERIDSKHHQKIKLDNTWYEISRDTENSIFNSESNKYELSLFTLGNSLDNHDSPYPGYQKVFIQTAGPNIPSNTEFFISNTEHSEADNQETHYTADVNELESRTINKAGDETPITIKSVSEVSVAEGSQAISKVTLSETTHQAITINLKLVGKTAEKNLDFSETLSVNVGNGWQLLDASNSVNQVVVPEGVSEFHVKASTLNNSQYEPSETFEIHAYIDENSPVIGRVTVTDEADNLRPDPAVVTLTGSQTVIESTKAEYTLTLDTPVPKAAIAKLDYQYINASGEDIKEVAYVEIEAGASSATFQIETLDDNLNEPGLSSFNPGESFVVFVTEVVYKHNGIDVFEVLDTLEAYQITTVVDENDNSPIVKLTDTDYSTGPDPLLGFFNRVEAKTGKFITGSVILDLSDHNKTDGTIGLDLNAKDEDVDDSISYTITKNYNNLFKIDSQTGEVSLKRPATSADLNGKPWEIATITVEAISTDESKTQSDFNISISDLSTLENSFIVANVTLDPVGADGFINADEATQNLTISGTVSGEFNANDAVTVSVGNNTYSANVDGDGNFSVTVPGSVLVDNEQVNVTATVSDDAGNTATITNSVPYTVDTDATAVTLTLDELNNGDTLNADDLTSDITLGGSSAMH